MYFFSFFISCNIIFFPNECPGPCRHRPGHEVEHKPLISEECNTIIHIITVFYDIFLKRE